MNRFLLPAAAVLAFSGKLAASDYAIVSSPGSEADAEWKMVAAKLAQKHSGAAAMHWEKRVTETLPTLQKQRPRFVAFVAKPEEVTVEFVRNVHQLTRRLDDDPYTDAFWGIVTGFDAENALAMAAEDKPLTIRKVASGTEVELSRCESGIWYCELNQGRMVRKDRDGDPKQGNGPADTTEALAKTLTEEHADLFITSGHATEHDWQIGYRYRNGSWRSKAGNLFGIDTTGRRIEIKSDNPKVYMPIGNCLMGHIDGPDAMALAFMKSASVRQMLGYVKPTWYGYQGWGCLDYFVEQPGRFTFCEAFFANQLALIHRLVAICPEADSINEVDDMGGSGKALKLTPAAPEMGLGKMDLQGLLFDRDVVAFYGDPAWEARMASGLCSWKQLWQQDGSNCTLRISPALGDKSFATVNRNGTQRGGRPIVHFLSRRIDPKSVKITAGEEHHPVITDDFVLVPLPAANCTDELVISFSATDADR